ncbi:MAG: polysaccharide deacetylase family protein [Clostridium sp.]|uniref:polysaccharide deacetylase family protein n=1 Tax=Clostridium sp. TaxID=1506 RepID=UPI003F3E96D0
MWKKFLLAIIFFVFFSILPVNQYYANSNENTTEKEKVVYLTFDDAPSKTVFKSILNTLDSEHVKGTFFVIGNQIAGNEEILKRAYDDGHALGLHSFTHEKKNLYNSNDKFLDEMITTQKEIDRVTCYSPKILRFPFGVNNNTYKLQKNLVDLLHKNNLKIYDWNVDSGDGLNPYLNPSAILKNSKSDKDSVVILMHASEVNKNTSKALIHIINYYKSNGYTFKTIDETTPEIYHYIK